MKRVIAALLVLVLMSTLAGCTEVTRIAVGDPAAIEVEKEGGSFTVKLTDAEMVKRITDIVEQLPLQQAEATEDQWSYRIVWLDASGIQITAITIHGTQISWEGQRYTLGLGVDLSKLTDVIETIPGIGETE